MKERLVCGFLAGMGIGMGLAQSPLPQPDPGPVQAELLANLDVHHLGSGKTIFASMIAKSSTLSNLMAPTLLNEGQVRLQSEPGGQWYWLAMSSWENQKTPLARIHSFCAPDVMSTAPDLLFLLTCDTAAENIQYSILRHDGKVLLRGSSDPYELGHEAMGSSRSQRFAVKIVHAERSIFPSTNFTNSELDSEEVRVYRAEDGKRLLAVRVKNPVASHGGFALSPDGSQLAVLSASGIEFFSVPAE